MLGVHFLLAASLQLSLDFVLLVVLSTLHIALAAWLANWPLRVFILLSSIILSIGVCYNNACDIPFRAIYSFPLLTSLIFSTLSFRKAKEALVARNKYLLAEQKKDQIKLVELVLFREKLVKQIDPDGIKFLDEATSNYLKQAIYTAKDHLHLKVSEIAIQKLVSDVSFLLRQPFLEAVPQLILKLKTRHLILQADTCKIKQLLSSSIHYIQQHQSRPGPISLTIEDTLLGYELSSIPGYLKKVDAIRIIVSSQGALPSLQEVYLAQEASYPRDLSMTTSQLPLLENAEIIEAHYGYLEQDKKDMHLYVVPITVREVRPRGVDSRRNPIAADPLELAHPLAIELEAALLSQVHQKGMDILIIHHALEVIEQYHAGVHRHSGEPFFTHPIAVALIVLEHSKDQDVVVAALLHDAVEDTPLTLAHVKVMFGERVGRVVDKVTNFESNLKKVKLISQETLVRLLHAEDEGVALVKLADRLHNTRTIISHTSFEKKKRIAKESLGFSVPFARLFKLDAIAQELEKRSLAILEK